MKEKKKQLTAPEWVVKEFEARRQRAHEVNIASLRRSIKRREHIREALLFGGAFLALGGVGNIETSVEVCPAAIVIITIGTLMMFVGARIIRGGENE